MKKDNDTLCWSCANTKCSWAKKLIPVEGWTATETVIKDNGMSGYMHSYQVKKCPEYKQESKDKQDFRKLCNSIDLKFYKNPKKRFTRLVVSHKYYKIIKKITTLKNFGEMFGVEVIKKPLEKEWRLEQ